MTEPRQGPQRIMHRAIAVSWELVRGLLRDFVWATLRDGVIRLKGFSAATKAVVVMASALLLATIIAFADGDVLRHTTHFIVIPHGLGGRGSLVPEPLVPVTFVLVAVGSALALAGALHAAVPVRAVVLFFFGGVAVAFQGLAQSVRPDTTVWPAWLLILAIGAVFIVRWRAAPRPAIEFAALLLLVAGALSMSERALVSTDRLSGGAFAVRQLSVLLGQLVLLATPLLLVAGLDIIAFGADLSSWALKSVDRRLPLRMVNVLLAALVGWRIRDLAWQSIVDIRGDGVASLEPALGVLLLIALLWAFWRVAGRVAAAPPGASEGEDSVEHGSAVVRLPLGAAYSALTLALVPVLLLLQSLTYFGVTDDRVIGRLRSLAEILGRADVVTAYRCGVGLTLVVVGIVVAHRGATTIAMFLGSVGLSDLVQQLFAKVGGLHKFLWVGPRHIDLAWMATFVAFGVWWSVRRKLTKVRAERLLFVVLLAALLRQFAFVSDPFRPLLGFAGIGFVAFGLIWGFLTSAGWTNEDSSRFPRSSRTFLYLGYSLFSVALLNWFAASHDVPQMSRFASFGTNGVEILGYPLLYTLFTLVLAGAIVDRPIDIEADDP